MRILARALPTLLAIAPRIGSASEAGSDDESVSLSGFVDTSVIAPLAGYGDGSDEVLFGLDEVEIDLDAALAPHVAVRADLNFAPTAPLESPDDLVEQGYGEVTTGPFSFLFGKQNALYGVEGVDRVDLVQFSASQMPTPWNLTGAFISYGAGAFGATAWVSNGGDTPATPRAATPGLRLEVTAQGLTTALTAVVGPVSAQSRTLLLDADAVLETGATTIMVEADLQSTGGAEALCVLATVHTAFSEAVGATLRADYLDDARDPEAAPTVSLTGAGVFFPVADWLRAVTELRVDLPRGRATAVTAAVSVAALWH